MRNSTTRVATFTGPGAEPVIRPVPWPQVQKNAAQLSDPPRRSISQPARLQSISFSSVV
jgi:hypothetical protein